MLGKLKASGWKNIDYAYKNKLQKYNVFITDKLQIMNDNESVLKICEKTDIIQTQRNFKWISPWEGGGRSVEKTWKNSDSNIYTGLTSLTKL